MYSHSHIVVTIHVVQGVNYGQIVLTDAYCPHCNFMSIFNSFGYPLLAKLCQHKLLTPNCKSQWSLVCVLNLSAACTICLLVCSAIALVIPKSE